MSTKNWGRREFWGLSSDFDQEWLFTTEQKKLRDDLIELCRVKIRPQAILSDKNYEFPRASLDAMASMGLLGLIVPKELGGLGQNHLCASMVVETLARYGCPSTAMIYTMHLAACAVLLFRSEENPTILNLLRRLDKDKMVGTLAYSDPATGGHFWFHPSSKTKLLDDGSVQLLKYTSWATSAGFADWYCIETVSPSFVGNYSDLSVFLVFKNEVRANTDDWSALGLHGNQSAAMVVEGVLTKDRLVGQPGDGKDSNSEPTLNYFLLNSSACWNGVSMGCMDIAKKHVTRKAHADVGMRICDYPSVQDYFANALTSTNVSRSHLFTIAQELDRVTNNNDWSLHKDRKFLPRTKYGVWLLQAKMFAAKNVTRVSDQMLSACGGSGYKTDLGLERLLRDARAGSVMAPSVEVSRQLIGKTVLMGAESNDMWQEFCNERILHHELTKMTLEEKKTLSKKLLEEIAGLEQPRDEVSHSFQESDFENPLNTAPPETNKQVYCAEGVKHEAVLDQSNWTSLAVKSSTVISPKMSLYVFSFPKAVGHSGCIAGQYVQIRVKSDDEYHLRYFSPISPPDRTSQIEFLMKFESRGILSQHFRGLKTGDELVEIRGPCGGFEYLSNQLKEITLIASGTGLCPALQIIRSSMQDKSDKTLIKLIYYAEDTEQMVFKQELDSFQGDSSRLTVFYTIGDVPENWDGEEGFIDTQMIEKFVSKPNGPGHKIILCGGPTMTIACLHSLRSLSYPSEMVFVYGQLGADQIKAVYGRNTKLSAHRAEPQ